MILHWIRGEFDQAPQLRELAFDELDSGGLESREGSVRHPLGLGVEPREPEGPNDSEAYPLQKTGGCSGSTTAERGVEQQQIGDRARVWTDLVEERRNRRTGVRRVPAGGGAKAREPAERRRHPDRSFRVLGNTERCHVVGDRCGRAAAAASGYTRRVVGIEDRAEGVVVARVAVGELMQVGLAEHYGARFAQGAYQGRILTRLEVPQRRCSRSRREVLRIDAVLDGDRQAVQAAEPGTGAALAIAGACGLQHGLRPQRNEGVESRTPFALVQQRTRITLGADLPAPQRARRLSRRECEQALFGRRGVASPDALTPPNATAAAVCATN